MHLFDAVRLAALGAVAADSDSEYGLRKVFRWYSKTFYTPLHEVDALPLEDVLTAYWEEHFEQMEEQALEDAVAKALETEEQKKDRITAETLKKIEDDEFFRTIDKKAQEKSAAPITERQDNPAMVTVPNRKLLPESELTPRIPGTPLTELPPDISVKFVDPDEIAAELDGDGFSNE